MNFVRACCVVAVALACSDVRAQSREISADPEAVVRERIARVQALLDESAGPVPLWQYGWTGLGYAVTGGFVAISAASQDKVQRLDFAFAAGGAFVDTTVHVLGSIHTHGAARLREQPDASPEQLRLKLAFAEGQLTAAAEAERDRRSLLKAQVLPVGFSVVTGLVLGLGFGHWRGAVINTTAAIVVNELRVLTQPTSSIAALERYQRDPHAATARRSRRGGLAWSWAASPLYLAIYGSF
jgi:hypothetical protein